MQAMRIRPTPERDGIARSNILVLVMACLASGCRARVDPAILTGRTNAIDCTKISLDGPPQPRCDPFELVDVSKIVVKQGEEVTLTGRYFRPSLTLASTDSSLSGGQNISYFRH